MHQGKGQVDHPVEQRHLGQAPVADALEAREEEEDADEIDDGAQEDRPALHQEGHAVLHLGAQLRADQADVEPEGRCELGGRVPESSRV